MTKNRQNRHIWTILEKENIQIIHIWDVFRNQKPTNPTHLGYFQSSYILLSDVK